MLLEALFSENFSVVSDGLGMILILFWVDQDSFVAVHALDAVICEQDSLAEEMCEDVIGADEL